jgi:hypothetical protein
MEFLKHLYNSLWNVDWLNKVKSNKKKSWIFFLFFMILLSVVQFGPMVYNFPSLVEEGKTLVVDNVPEFTATFTDGELSVTELEQPYILEKDVDGDGILFYVDTSSTEPLNIKNLVKEYETEVGILITNDSLDIYTTEDGQLKSQDLGEIEDFSFDKSILIAFVENWAGKAGFGLAIIIAIIMFVLMTAGKLIYLLILSLVTKAVSDIAKKKWSYGDIYTLGLSTIILPSVLMLLSATLFKERPTFAYSIIFYVVTLTVIFKHSGKAHKKEHHSDDKEKKDTK